MNKYLPSKKFSYILLSIIIAVGIIYGFSWLKDSKKNTEELTNIQVQTKVEEFMALDTDGDGMKDWEEALWKTDPNKTDTDGDGTSDSEEINLNRDPLKQNINPDGQTSSDKISEEIIASNKKVQEEFDQLNTTEKMGRVLFGQYIATKKIDSALTETDKLQIVESTMANLPAVTLNIYSAKDIIIDSASDNETLRKYTNNIALIILNNLKVLTESVDEIITDFSKIENDEKISQDTTVIFKRFDPLIIKNRKTVDDLLKLSVPQVLVAEHLDLLNSFYMIYQSLDLMQKSATDLITLIPVLNDYDKVSQSLADSLLQMTKKLADLKVNFTGESDYGYQFFNVIIYK